MGEKFKFVLDYKIKELKRQIEPRETEIANMKHQIKDMDRELEQYHKSNAQLDLMIGDLRVKLDDMQLTIGSNRKLIGDAESAIIQFKGEVHECVQFIQDPVLLADAVRKLSTQHQIASPEVGATLDGNVAHEYHRHKDYLQRTFKTLKDKFTEDIQTHQAANTRVMRDNMNLIRDINKQREANRAAKQHQQARQAAMQREKLRQQQRAVRRGGKNPEEDRSSARIESAAKAKSRDAKIPGQAMPGGGNDAALMIEANRERIYQMRQLLESLEERYTNPRPNSRGALPPVDKR